MKKPLVLQWAPRSLVKFGIITQAEARHFPTELLHSNLSSARSETGVFWSLCPEEGLSDCEQCGAVEVLGAQHGPQASPERETFPLGSENGDLKFSTSLVLSAMPSSLDQGLRAVNCVLTPSGFFVPVYGVLV